jgi:hypothetical protein
MAPSGQLSSRATLLALALLLVVRLAAAQPPPAIQILWSAPPSCPSQSDVEAEVSRTIGARATRPEPLRARMEVWQSEAGGWKGDIELSAASQVTPSTTRRRERVNRLAGKVPPCRRVYRGLRGGWRPSLPIGLGLRKSCRRMRPPPLPRLRLPSYA